VRLAAPIHKHHRGSDVSGGFNGAASHTLRGNETKQDHLKNPFAFIGVHLRADFLPMPMVMN
jgi:hypothetical protein